MNFTFEDWIQQTNPDMVQIREMFEKFREWDDLLNKNIEPRFNRGMI
jgi:hypothetical protein